MRREESHYFKRLPATSKLVEGRRREKEDSGGGGKAGSPLRRMVGLFGRRGGDKEVVEPEEAQVKVEAVPGSPRLGMQRELSGYV